MGSRAEVELGRRGRTWAGRGRRRTTTGLMGSLSRRAYSAGQRGLGDAEGEGQRPAARHHVAHDRHVRAARTLSKSRIGIAAPALVLQHERHDVVLERDGLGDAHDLARMGRGVGARRSCAGPGRARMALRYFTGATTTSRGCALQEVLDVLHRAQEPIADDLGRLARIVRRKDDTGAGSAGDRPPWSVRRERRRGRPRRCGPWPSASSRASRSTRAPRAVLMRMAERFMRANSLRAEEAPRLRG